MKYKVFGLISFIPKAGTDAVNPEDFQVSMCCVVIPMKMTFLGHAVTWV
jgi:hypothetical protein